MIPTGRFSGSAEWIIKKKTQKMWYGQKGLGFSLASSSVYRFFRCWQQKKVCEFFPLYCCLLIQIISRRVNYVGHWMPVTPVKNREKFGSFWAGWPNFLGVVCRLACFCILRNVTGYKDFPPLKHDRARRKKVDVSFLLIPFFIFSTLCICCW